MCKCEYVSVFVFFCLFVCKATTYLQPVKLKKGLDIQSPWHIELLHTVCLYADICLRLFYSHRDANEVWVRTFVCLFVSILSNGGGWHLSLDVGCLMPGKICLLIVRKNVYNKYQCVIIFNFILFEVSTIVLLHDVFRLFTVLFFYHRK